jgi:hypothetical protein
MYDFVMSRPICLTMSVIIDLMLQPITNIMKTHDPHRHFWIQGPILQ